MKFLYIALGLLLFGAAVVSVPVAFAQDLSPTNKIERGIGTLKNRQANQEERQSNLEQQRQARCEAVRSRLAELPNQYRTRHQNHLRVFERVATAAERALSKFAAAGLDTNALAKHIDTLRSQIVQFNTNAEAYLSGLATVEPCDSEGTIKPGQWANARSLLNVLGSDVRAIRSTIQNQLRPEIVRLNTLMARPSVVEPSLSVTATP